MTKFKIHVKRLFMDTFSKTAIFAQKRTFSSRYKHVAVLTGRDDMCHMSTQPLKKSEMYRPSSYLVIAFPVAQKSTKIGQNWPLLPLFSHVCPYKSRTPNSLVPVLIPLDAHFYALSRGIIISWQILKFMRSACLWTLVQKRAIRFSISFHIRIRRKISRRYR